MQFVQFSHQRLDHNGRSRVKGTGERATRRRRPGRRPASKRTQSTSPKAAEIVSLVHALTTDLGSNDGVIVGRGIAELLAEAYRIEGLPLPRWVDQLTAQFAPKKRSS